MIKRYKPWRDPYPEEPFIADVNTFDIPETICACIRNAPPHCVAITLKPYGGARMIALAEHTARRKGIRLIWRPIGPRRPDF